MFQYERTSNFILKLLQTRCKLLSLNRRQNLYSEGAFIWRQAIKYYRSPLKNTGSRPNYANFLPANMWIYASVSALYELYIISD